MNTKPYFTCLFLIIAVALIAPATAQTRASAGMDSEPCVAFGQSQAYMGLNSAAHTASGQKETFAHPDSAILAALESTMFAHPYSQDSSASRVARLERFVLGATRDGLPLPQRITMLLSDVRNGVATAAADVPERMQPARNSSATKQATCAEPSPGVRYPHVTELEHQICRRTFETEPVRQRLERLEMESFGKPSASVDLARRVDALDWYAFAAPPVRTADYSEFADSQRSADFQHWPAVVSTSSGPQFVSVVDQIECLERSTFGCISANKPLEKRVDALEKHVYGAMQTKTNEALSSRVTRLWASLTSANSSRANRPGV